MEDHNDNFILIPAKSGGGALVRRSQVAGGRANGADGAILYLASGPSVYTTATIPQLAEYLGARKAEIAGSGHDLRGLAMIPRKNPTEAQMVRRQQREPIGPKDARARHDPYWALRLQGYSNQCAKRAFRDIPPRYYKEELRVSEEYIADVDPEDLLFIPSVATDRQVLAVLERPDLTDETVATAPPRAVEYTIWSETPHGFGLRIRPSGARSYIVMFRIKGNKRQYKLTLGKVGDFPLGLARKLAREARIEASAGNDPRPMHKSGQLLRQVHQSERVLDGFPRVTPEKQGNALPSETILKETSRPQVMPMDCKQGRNIQRDTYAAEVDPDTEI